LSALWLPSRRAGAGRGKAKKIVFVLGHRENLTDAKFDPADSQTINKKPIGPVIARHLRFDKAENAFQHLHEYRPELLGIPQVSISDELADRIVTFTMSRSVSFCESGIGHYTRASEAEHNSKGRRMKRGDFYGEETLVLENEHLRVEVLAAAGPRIVRVQLAGSSENVLAEVADIGSDTPWGYYRLRGGHRLWFAPENPPITAAPDEDGLIVEERPRGLRLERLEPQSRLRKTIEIELATERADMTVKHGLRNEGEETVEHAPWAITIMPFGGVAILPQQRGPIGDKEFLPNRTLTFWPYSSILDSRLELGDELVLVHGEPAPTPFKIGYLNRVGWVAYLRNGILLRKGFDPQPELKHPDLGSNAEVYCNDRIFELETLGPLSVLEPGAEAWHEERWQLRSVGSIKPGAKQIAAALAELDA
jgi:hypothetical protein